MYKSLPVAPHRRAGRLRLVLSTILEGPRRSLPLSGPLAQVIYNTFPFMRIPRSTQKCFPDGRIRYVKWSVSPIRSLYLTRPQPCKQCSMTKTKSKSCVPLWRYPDNKRKVGSMWCSNCRENGEPDCSFVPSKLGVRHLPTITPTEAGNTRRQLEASTPTPSPQSSRQDASHRTSKPSIRFPPSSSTAVSSGSGKHQGQVETIILGDFVSFEDILRDANRSSLSLEAARIEIRSMMSREIGSLKVLTKTIEERQQALSHLESRFTRDITRLRAEEGGGVPSLSEGVNVTPGEEQQPSVGRRSKVVVRVMSVVPDSEEE